MIVGLSVVGMLHWLEMISSMVRNHTASLDASWNAINSAWLVDVAVTVCLTWKYVKQTVTATSTNHAELIAFHEASREAVWLRTMEEIISSQCNIPTTDKPTIIYEDNASCVRQMQSGFIKADRTKHISPHIFTFSQDLVDKRQIEIRV